MKYVDNNGLLYFWNKIKNYFVPRTRKINNKALSSDITLNASDVGALSSIPIATESTLGGVKSGGGVTIAPDGTISASGGANVQMINYTSEDIPDVGDPDGGDGDDDPVAPLA